MQFIARVFVLLGLLTSSHFIDAAEIAGRVVGISDGDTLTLLDAGNKVDPIFQTVV